MSDHDKMDADGLGFTMMRPVFAEVVLKDRTTGEQLISLGEFPVEPGSTVTWTYPAGGLRVVMD